MSGLPLLVVFVISVVAGQTISVAIGLFIEHHITPYAGMIAFVFCYFAIFWVAWRFAVRATEPRGRRRKHGTPATILLAYAIADEAWTGSALLI